ncbi:hypothetical protein I552_5803 [Mycobacterium xenopi 3993]|nr:hypothetical protein I552_5803 [Mycobacterium xenopi 3993]
MDTVMVAAASKIVDTLRGVASAVVATARQVPGGGSAWLRQQ